MSWPEVRNRTGRLGGPDMAGSFAATEENPASIDDLGRTGRLSAPATRRPLHSGREESESGAWSSLAEPTLAEGPIDSPA